MALKIRWKRDYGAMTRLSERTWRSQMRLQYEQFFMDILSACGITIPLTIRVKISTRGDYSNRSALSYRFPFFWFPITSYGIEISGLLFTGLPSDELRAIIAHEAAHIRLGHLDVLRSVRRYVRNDGFLDEVRADRFAERIVGLEAILSVRERFTKPDDLRRNRALLKLLRRRMQKGLQQAS